MNALDGLRDRIGETGIDDAIVAESSLVGVGEGESSSFRAVLTVA
jgi:hypothetical protein